MSKRYLCCCKWKLLPNNVSLYTIINMHGYIIGVCAFTAFSLLLL